MSFGCYFDISTTSGKLDTKFLQIWHFPFSVPQADGFIKLCNYSFPKNMRKMHNDMTFAWWHKQKIKMVQPLSFAIITSHESQTRSGKHKGNLEIKIPNPDAFSKGCVGDMCSTKSKINSLHAKFFRGNISMYLHFMSFLHTDMPKKLKSFLVRPGLTYFS